MVVHVVLKDKEGNQINQLMNGAYKEFNVPALTVQDGFLVNGDYYIPLSNILIAKEL